MALRVVSLPAMTSTVRKRLSSSSSIGSSLSGWPLSREELVVAQLARVELLGEHRDQVVAWVLRAAPR